MNRKARRSILQRFPKIISRVHEMALNPQYKENKDILFSIYFGLQVALDKKDVEALDDITAKLANLEQHLNKDTSNVGT